MGVLVEQVQDGPVGGFQRVRAGNLDQLRRFRQPVEVRSLFERQTHALMLRHAADFVSRPLMHPFCRNAARSGAYHARPGQGRTLTQSPATIGFQYGEGRHTRFVPSRTRFVAMSREQHPFRRIAAPVLSQPITRFVAIPHPFCRISPN